MNSNFKEIREFVQQWSENTEKALLAEIDRLKVKNTNMLRAGVQARVKEVMGEQLLVEIMFRQYGRFVDMGAGRHRIEGREGTRAAVRGKSRKQKQRKAKRWYSPVFFGRLSGLRGVLSYKITERIIRKIHMVEA